MQQDLSVPEPFPAVEKSGYVLVAALLPDLPDGPVQHVKQGVVPVEGQGGHGGKTHPQIAPANRIELVKQQTLEGFRFQGLFRQQNERMENARHQR